jgi:hypothetical protein
VGELARNDFAEGDVGQAHAWRGGDQWPVTAHQLPDSEPNDIHEKMLVRDRRQGAV